MKTFKPGQGDLDSLQSAAKALKEANAAIAKANKAAEAAKELLTNWLKTSRDVVLETLPIGEKIFVEAVVMIEINKQSRFDEKGFQLANPTMHTEWMKERPIKKFTPLAE